jgi:hypothetical protein
MSRKCYLNVASCHLLRGEMEHFVASVEELREGLKRFLFRPNFEESYLKIHF